MGQVIASASMSLDGYIAKDDNTIGRALRLVAERRGRAPHGRRPHHLPPEPGQRRVLAHAGWTGWVRWCAGARCSTSPTGGAGSTPWVCRWSW